MSIRARFRHTRGDFTLDVDLMLPGAGVTALFGPSGSGKTTLLRCIAGLEDGVTGQLYLNSQCLHDTDASIGVPTHQRKIGMVFQDENLFAHLNVRKNLAFGLARTAPGARRLGMEQAVAWLDLASLLDRSVATLSGGERQRVSIARALLASPQLLLLDEPLSALDARRKQEILPYLQRLHDELDIPVIYITHAIDEVVRIADHLVLLDGGRCVAQGALSDTLGSLDLPAAFLDESSVILDAVVAELDSRHGLARLASDCGTIWTSAKGLATGARTRVRIQSRDVSIALRQPVATSVLNVFKARVLGASSASQGGQVIVACRSGNANIVARITSKSFELLGIEAGMEVWLQVKTVSLS